MVQNPNQPTKDNGTSDAGIQQLSNITQAINYLGQQFAQVVAGLDVTTTRGDMIARGATVNQRLPIGAEGSLLHSDGTDPGWLALGSQYDVLQSNGSDAVWDEYITTTRGDLITRGASNPQRLAIGSSGQVLGSDGTDPSWSRTNLTGSGTRSTSTGSTTISFLSVIPSWANEVTLSFAAISLSGSDAWLIQLGTSGSYTTSGYSSASGIYYSTSTVSISAVTTSGFIILAGNAANTLTGTIILNHIGSNQWIASGTFFDSSVPYMGTTAGRITLGGVLDSIRFATNGSNTVDANAGVNVTWR